MSRGPLRCRPGGNVRSREQWFIRKSEALRGSMPGRMSPSWVGRGLMSSGGSDTQRRAEGAGERCADILPWVA